MLTHAEHVEQALQLMYPHAQVQAREEQGKTRLLVTVQTEAGLLWFSTPAGGDYKSHDMRWWIHRFADLLQARGLERAPAKI